MLHDASFGENTPLGGSIFSSNLDGLVASDVIHFRNASFCAENVCVAVHSGNADGVGANNMLAELLSSGIPSGQSAVFAAGFTGGEMRVRENIGGDTRASLAFSAPAGNSGTTIRFGFFNFNEKS